MYEQVNFDHYAIRSRLVDLKKKAGMSNYEFCKIYAPEKCDSKSNADNYISAVFTGRNHPNVPIYPDLVHLQNLVDSCVFPNLTLNYLVFGDDPAIVIKEKVDLNIEHWTIADFCILIGKIVDRYPEIKVMRSVLEEFSVTDNYGEEFTESQNNFVIKIQEFNDCAQSGFDLGLALSEFFEKYENMKQIQSDAIQNAMYERIIEAVNKDPRYSKQSLASCDKEDHFTYWEDGGLSFKGLELD